MSSPTFATEHGNGISDQFGLNGIMMSGDQSSATIIGAMKPYTIPKSDDGDNYNDKLTSIQVSTLPTSSTTSTSTISTSNTNSSFSPAPMGNGGTDDVCRDFLRNMCRRGKSCRYKHPDNEGAGGDMMMASSNASSMGNNRKDSYVFCHDFQNRECRRDNCRFLHCSKQEASMMLAQPIVVPDCKDFLNGVCRRAPGRCKFRHPASNESYNQSPSPTNSRNSFDGRNGGQRGAAPVGNFAMSPMNNSHNLDAYGYGRPPITGTNMAISSNYGYGNDQYVENGNSNKRKRNYDTMYATNNAVPYGAPAYGQEAMNPIGTSVHGYAMHSTPANAYYAGVAGNGGGVGVGVAMGRGPMVEGRSFLEEENSALRRRIDDLKKQVSELLSTNEYLMEQINQMRSTPAAAVAVATATSVASLQPPPQSSTATAVGISSISAGQLTQTLSLQQAPTCSLSVPQPPPPPGTGGLMTGSGPVGHMGPLTSVLPPSSIVSSIASISLPTVSTALVSSSGAASLVSYTPLHSTWSLGVDQ